MTHSSFPIGQGTRRRFLKTGSVILAATHLSQATAMPTPAEQSTSADDQPTVHRSLCIDTHMHVWSGDAKRFPFSNPKDPNYSPPAIAATAELLVEEMDSFGITHCVLVQTICHGWDNACLAHCLKTYPDRFRGHGLINPTDDAVAEKLEYWIRERGLGGMRFSPIYYENRDEWMNSSTAVELWKKAETLGAIFNFFISTPQLPKLEQMVRQFPAVPVVIDHLARIDLKQADPLPEFQKLLALAKYPNVYVKVSELSVLSPSETYPWSDTFPWVRRMYDAFGPDRMLWGTGFPGATRVQAGRPTLTQELDLIRHEIPFFTAEDRVKILGTNAARLWKFT
jgi:L-fuconolactonase